MLEDIQVYAIISGTALLLALIVALIIQNRKLTKAFIYKNEENETLKARVKELDFAFTDMQFVLSRSGDSLDEKIDDCRHLIETLLKEAPHALINHRSIIFQVRSIDGVLSLIKKSAERTGILPKSTHHNRTPKIYELAIEKVGSLYNK